VKKASAGFTMADSVGLESGVVRLVEYDARWPALFAAERSGCGTGVAVGTDGRTGSVASVGRTIAGAAKPKRHWWWIGDEGGSLS